MLVLPTLPVMPTTVAVEPVARPRRQRPSAPPPCRRRRSSATRRRRPARRGQRRGRARRRGGGDEVVAVALGDERHEQLAGPQRAGVERGAVDVDVGADAACRRSRPRPRRMPGSSRRRTVPSASDDAGRADPPRRAVRRAVGRARRQLRRPPPTCSRAADPARYRITPIGISTDGRVGARRRRASGRWRPGRRRCRRGSTRPATSVVADAVPRRGRRPASAPSCCRCCTARWARTAPCRGCSSWPTCRTSAPACSARRWRWTRRWPSRCSPPTASRRPATGRSREHERTPGLPGELADELGLPLLRQAGEHGLVGRRHARRRRVEELRDAIDARAHLRRVGRRRGGGRRPRDRGRRARQPRPAGVGAGRDRPRRRVLRLRGQVRHRRRPAADPGAADAPSRPPRCGRWPCEVFRALRCDGLARVDFFFEEGGRGFLCNEVNTMPGFTPISMYPKLWQASRHDLPRADRPAGRAGARAPRPPAPQHQAPLTASAHGRAGRRGGRRAARRGGGAGRRRDGVQPTPRSASGSVAMPVTVA